MQSRRFACVVLTLILICSLALTGCGKQNDLTGITVTYVTSPLNVPSIVEKNHGIFAENMKKLGIETVQYSELTSGADQTQALASGDIQFLYCVGATSVILSAANGADIRIISMYSRSPEAFCLFSNDSSIDTPAALRGNVDCALLAGAAAYNTKAAGAHLVTNGKGLVEATICCATTQKFYDGHKDVVKAFLEAQQAVLNYVKEHEDDALQEAADTLDLDIQAVRDMYAYYDFDMTIRDSDITAMTSTMQFMLDNGMIENPVDINGLVIR